MKSRIGKIATALTLVVVILAGINYIGEPVEMVPRSFGEVIEPFLEIRTATFSIVVQDEEDPCGLTMAGLFAAPGRMRLELQDAGVKVVTICDAQEGKSVILTPSAMTALVIEREEISEDSQLGPDMFLEIWRQLQEAKAGRDENVEMLGEREIDGLVVQGYLLKEENGDALTVWLDEESMLPLQIETELAALPSQKTVMSDFEFNVQLDESLFSLEIPEGYRDETITLDTSEAVEKDLVEMLKVWAEKTGGRFPSALSLDVDVMVEFTAASIPGLGGQERKEYPNNTEQFHQLLNEIKLDRDKFEKLIQGGQADIDAVALSERIEEHLATLRQLNEEKREVDQQRRDDFTGEFDGILDGMGDMLQDVMLVSRGMKFVTSLGADSAWRYAGEYVEYGDSETPIFWYRPTGSDVCRVIYGDLSMRDVTWDEEPLEPESSPEDATDEMKPLEKLLNSTSDPFESTEEDFIEALEIWVKFMDGKFPASVDSAEQIREFSDRQYQRLHISGELVSDRRMVEMGGDMRDIMWEIRSHISTEGRLFVFLLDAESNWRYAGRGVSFGDSEKAIFWYRPEGSDRYRVIYADLTVREMVAEELPADSGEMQRYEDLHRERPTAVEVEEVANDPAAVEILGQVQEMYGGLESYHSTVEVLADYSASSILNVNDVAGLTPAEITQLHEDGKLETKVDIRYVTKTKLAMTLARPELYSMEWTTTYIEGRGRNYSGDRVGCAWSDGNGYAGIEHGKKRYYTQAHFGGPWGSSDTVPTVFYDRFNNYFKSLEELAKEDDAPFEGEPCHVVSGFHHGRAVKLWISKERLLVLKREEAITLDSGSAIEKEMIETTIAIMGNEMSPEEIAGLRETISDEAAKRAFTQGLATEIHRDIVLDEPVRADELLPALAAEPGEE
jgi:outer membrane lipoprotein-sorting protein